MCKVISLIIIFFLTGCSILSNPIPTNCSDGRCFKTGGLKEIRLLDGARNIQVIKNAKKCRFVKALEYYAKQISHIPFNNDVTFYKNEALLLGADSVVIKSRNEMYSSANIYLCRE